jgi:hypothetical protein
MTEKSKAQRLADEFDNGELIAHTNQWKEEATSELRRLDRHEQVNTEWLEKTEWVQKTAKAKELGMHRADVLKKRIDDLTALNAELVEHLQRLCDETEQGFFSTITRAECRLLIAKAKEQT